MLPRVWLFVAALVVGCSSESAPPAPIGRLVIAVTIDWEGAYLSADGLDALDTLRATLGTAPVTHFVSAAYFTKEKLDPRDRAFVAEAIRKDDELAVHLHAWGSLARASKIEPKLSPSFLTGTGKLVPFEDGDLGFDTDLDVYSVLEIRALLRTSRDLLAEVRPEVSTSFRAGGYLGTPKVLQAVREEGFLIDSSATDHRQLRAANVTMLSRRVKEVWPAVGATSQPYLLPGTRSLIEVPISAFADHLDGAALIALLDAAHARLLNEPDRDVIVVLGLHQETAHEFGERLIDALEYIHRRPEIAKDLLFLTVEQVAERVRSSLTTTPRI